VHRRYKKMTNFAAHWIREFRRCGTADMRSETTEEDMKAAEEGEKGADDPSDSTPLCSEFEGCVISTASISETE